MGTNYYVVSNCCDKCNRYDEEYHIGKSSYGWAFSFRGYRSERLVSWAAWKEFLKNKIIMNEYGERIDYDWFVQYIENEKAPAYVNSQNGHKNLIHNEQGRKPNSNGWSWYNPEYDWDCEQGYSFSSREFS